MNKQLIKDLSQELVDKFELDKKQANSFVEKMFSVLQKGLQDEKIVKIKGLGTFKVISVQSRKSIDVNTGEPILIDGRDKISFTPDSDMRDYVNRPFAQFETVAINDGTDFSLIDKKFAEGEQEDAQENAQEEEEENQDALTTEVVQENSLEEKQEKVQTVEVQNMTREDQQEAEASLHDDHLHDDRRPNVASVEEETPAQEAPSMIDSANEQEVVTSNDVTSNDVTSNEVTSNEVTSNEVTSNEVTSNEVTSKEEEEAPKNVLTQESIEGNQKSERTDSKAKEIERETKDIESEERTTDPEQNEHVVETEQNEHVVDTEQNEQAADIEQQVHAATVNISQQFEDENQILQAANEELRNNFRHQYRMMKGLITFFVVVVLLCLGGGYFLLNQLKKRDHRIEMLEILAYRNKKGINAQPGNDSTLATKTTAKQPSLSKQASKAQAKVKAEETVKTESKRTTDNNPSLSSGSTASGSNQSDNAQHNTMKSAAEANHAKLVPAETTESKQDKEQTAYNQDVRIRTGAYRIVGISHTVKVRSGQTLYSISRANLGPGMECYVQAVNGGKTNFKAGETVKIPKLQIKKKK